MPISRPEWLFWLLPSVYFFFVRVGVRGGARIGTLRSRASLPRNRGQGETFGGRDALLPRKTRALFRLACARWGVRRCADRGHGRPESDIRSRLSFLAARTHRQPDPGRRRPVRVTPPRPALLASFAHARVAVYEMYVRNVRKVYGFRRGRYGSRHPGLCPSSVAHARVDVYETYGRCADSGVAGTDPVTQARARCLSRTRALPCTKCTDSGMAGTGQNSSGLHNAC